EARDTALRVPPGVEGTVINVRVFSSKGVAKDERSQNIEEEEIRRLKKDQEEEVRIIQDSTLRKIKQLLVGKTVAVRISDDDTRRVLLPNGKELTEAVLDALPAGYSQRLKGGSEHTAEARTRI